MGDIRSLPGSLPKASIPGDVDAAGIASACLPYLEDLQGQHLAADALWRDFFALTGTLRTIFSRESIIKAWHDLVPSMKPHSYSLEKGSCRVVRVGASQHSWILARFTFQTDSRLPSTCSGFLHLVPSDQGWKIWVMRTILESFKGHGNVDSLQPLGHMGANDANGHKTMEQPLDAIIVGGGPSGLSTAGRLKALGLSCLLVEKYPKIGDNWGRRYNSAKLHTPKQYGHLPFDRQFFEKDEEWLGQQTLSVAYEEWAKRFALNAWTASTVKSAKWLDEEGLWRVEIEKSGSAEYLQSEHLILAIGIGGQNPKMPPLANRELFRGEVLHSADYHEPGNWAGKKGVVVGSANTAHDVAEDMLAANMSAVTMVQRGHTYVIPRECLTESFIPLYNTAIPTDLADRMSLTSPMAVTRDVANCLHHEKIHEKASLYDGLEAAGFKLERFGDMNMCLYQNFGGHYIDTGTSEKIANGAIVMKSDAKLTGFGETGLEFDDGSTLEADVVIFCTGFEHNMRDFAAAIVGEEVASSVDEFWGVDEEGEIRGAWKPAGVPHLWYMGGTLGQARLMSRFVALQIQAEKLGKPMTPYLRS